MRGPKLLQIKQLFVERCAADDKDWRYGVAWLLFAWGLAFWCALGWLDLERVHFTAKKSLHVGVRLPASNAGQVAGRHVLNRHELEKPLAVVKSHPDPR